MWTGLLQRMRGGRNLQMRQTARHWTGAYGDIPTEIDPDRYASVVELLDKAMKRFHDKVAFRSFGGSLTFGEVDKLSSAFCAYLQSKLGVKKGDRIAVMVPTLQRFPSHSLASHGPAPCRSMSTRSIRRASSSISSRTRVARRSSSSTARRPFSPRC